jgi:predicted Zn-dependent peptidase
MKKADPKKPAKEEAPKTDKPAPATHEAKTEKKADNKSDNTTQSEVQPPTPQTPKTSSWRKHEERMLEKQQQERQRQLLRQQQQEAYGYSPFKGNDIYSQNLILSFFVAPPYPIYDQRSQTPRDFGPNPSKFKPN